MYEFLSIVLVKKILSSKITPIVPISLELKINCYFHILKEVVAVKK